MKLRDPTAPGSTAGQAAYRLMMAAASLRLAGARDETAGAVALALRGAAAGRFPPQERAWLGRIEAQRRELAPVAVEHSLDTRGLEADQWLAEASVATRWMSMPPVLGRLLMRLARELRPRSCLELGTGFGVSTAYQAAALELNGRGRITSLDVEGMISMAQPALDGLGLGARVELVAGRIEDKLAGAVEASAPVDLAVLDADHTKAGTLASFEAILPGLSHPSVVILDDVNWTEEMRSAWRAIGAHPRVGRALGLRRLGIAIVAGAGGHR